MFVSLPVRTPEPQLSPTSQSYTHLRGPSNCTITEYLQMVLCAHTQACDTHRHNHALTQSPLEGQTLTYRIIGALGPTALLPGKHRRLHTCTCPFVGEPRAEPSSLKTTLIPHRHTEYQRPPWVGPLISLLIKS
jgi:hypothetical protein